MNAMNMPDQVLNPEPPPEFIDCINHVPPLKTLTDRDHDGIITAKDAVLPDQDGKKYTLLAAEVKVPL